MWARNHIVNSKDEATIDDKVNGFIQFFIFLRKSMLIEDYCRRYDDDSFVEFYWSTSLCIKFLE